MSMTALTPLARRRIREKAQSAYTAMDHLAALVAAEIVKIEDPRLRRMRYWEHMQAVSSIVERNGGKP